MELNASKRAKSKPSSGAWMNAIRQLPNIPARSVVEAPRGSRANPTQSSVWTDGMCEFLERYYPIMSNVELSAELRKGKTTVRAQASAMGLNKMFGRNKPPAAIYRDVIARWKEGQSNAMIIMVVGVTEEEIAAAIKHYERYGECT